MAGQMLGMFIPLLFGGTSEEDVEQFVNNVRASAELNQIPENQWIIFIALAALRDRYNNPNRRTMNKLKFEGRRFKEG